MPSRSRADAFLLTIVLFHFVVCAVHGLAHARAGVDLPPAAMLFVFAVIVVGPIAGVLVRLAARRGGAWVVALTLAAAFVFGLVNHFVISGADHVSHVSGPWSATFGVTAALLAVTEAGGSAIGAWYALRSRA